jgi:hypothetical protein
MSTPIKFGELFHTGIAVRDVDAAKAEYADLMDVTFEFQGEVEVPVWLPEGARMLNVKFAYTAQGPHRLELVRTVPGTWWGVPGAGHAHHLGYWCDDVPAATAELTRRNLSLVAKVGVLEADLDAPIVIFQTTSGLYVELVSSELQAQMFGANDHH